MVNFFVIGVQKAGTSTLHEWLIQHPDIYLPKIKEVHYFDDPNRFNLGIDWYDYHYKKAKNGQLLGEVCPDYIFYPDVADKIYRYNNQAKIISVFRDPLDRAYSHYLMTKRRGKEDLSFNEALKSESLRLSSNKYNFVNHYSYLSRSSYVEQIMKYQEKFKDILIVKFEDVIKKRNMSAIVNYLKISQYNFNYSVNANQASVPRFKFINDLVYKDSLLRKISKIFFKKNVHFRTYLKQKIDQMNQVKPVFPISNKYNIEEIDSKFLQIFYENIVSFERITGIDCSDWKEKYIKAN